MNKSEILRLKNDIDKLFNEGKAVKVLPLKVIYLIQLKSQITFQPSVGSSDDFSVKVFFAVGKRTVKKASHRNRVKRCMREAYRQLKPALMEMVGLKREFGAGKKIKDSNKEDTNIKGAVSQCSSTQQIELWLGFMHQTSGNKPVNTEMMKKSIVRAIEKIANQLFV